MKHGHETRLKNDFFCVVADGVRKVVKKRNTYVLLCIILYYVVLLLILVIIKKRGRKIERRKQVCFAKKTKRTLEAKYALKMFDDICLYIYEHKNDKNKIKQMYIVLNDEFFEICKNKEFAELLYPFKVVISFFLHLTV